METLVAYYVAYSVGYVLAFISIGVFNRRCIDEIDQISVKHALLLSFSSWLMVLVMLLALIVTFIKETQKYRDFEDYFEGRDKRYR